MSTFEELQAEVRNALGGVDTTNAVNAIKRGLNAGLHAAAVMYQPQESQKDGSVIASSSAERVSLVDLTRLLFVISVYSETSTHRVYPLPFVLLNAPWVPSSGVIKFYCQYGSYLYYRPKADETLRVYYIERPARLENDSDEYPYTMHEDFVIAFAAAYAWAYLEEGESSDLWSKIADRVSIPDSMATMLRQVIQLNPSVGGKDVNV